MADPTPQERARALIERNTLLALATADPTGRPWVSPVFYAFDDRHRLYWVSDAEARHSAHVRSNGAVALVIHDTVDGRVDAVYVDASAIELDDEDSVTEGMRVMASRDDLQPPYWRIGDIGDVTGSGPWRIYRATRESTWVRDRGERLGKPVVGRVPADF